MRAPLAALIAGFATLSFGQATSPDDPIVPVRPSFSDTTTIVPVRRLQIEAGATYFRRGGEEEERWQIGEALLRYGLRPRVELRVGLPNEVLIRRTGLDGGDNATLGASIYLGRVFGFDVATAPSVAFPTGSPELRDEVVTPSVSLTLQRPFGHGSIGSTLSTAFGREEGRGVVDTTATLIDQQPLSSNLTGFVEYAGSFSRLGPPEHLAHFGLQLATAKNASVDLHVGLGLGDAAPHELVGAGFAVRF